MIRIGFCSICNKLRILWWETPDDPPFFPKGGGRHCAKCEHWLETGELVRPTALLQLNQLVKFKQGGNNEPY